DQEATRKEGYGVQQQGKRIFTNIANILWTTADPSNDTPEGPVSITRSVMFAGSVSPKGMLYSLDDPTTGSVLWSYETGATIYGGVSASYGCIYVGHGYTLGVAKFKARLVAKGFSQKEGMDYHEVFSPVVKHKTIRVLLAMVGDKSGELDQFDVKTAFLHGNLEERIYISQPEGSTRGKRFDSFMVSNGYIRNQFDNCVYSKKVSGDFYVYVLLYVDNMLVAAKDMTVINDLKALVKSEFEMKDLGAAKKILGMEIWRDRKAGRLWVSQEKYIEKALQAFFCRLVQTVGSLMYAMVCTRPDLAHAVSVVSRFMANPGKAHWKAVKWILRYLKGVSNICLVYDGEGHGDGLVGYADSDYGGDLVKRRSLTCFIFTLFGCAVSWKSTLQPTVALSTTEAEYMSMTKGIKECIWLHGLVQSLGLKVEKPVLFCDSQSALSLAKNSVYHERTKHIDVRLNFIRDVLEEVKSLRGIWCRKETTKRDTEEPLVVGAIPSQGGDCCLSDLDLAIYYPK
ncbi:retrovirus-related pol polyprotein from transposon TNT 1-94, partial [Tanacetum coccineum]